VLEPSYYNYCPV